MPPKRAKKMTRDQERSLDIEIGFLEGVVRRDPGYIDALQILGDNYTRRGRFEDGLKVDEQLVRLRPADANQLLVHLDRKSTRLNSSHSQISYAVFCLKKNKQLDNQFAKRHT